MLSVHKSQIEHHPSEYNLLMSDLQDPDVLFIVPYIVLHMTNPHSGKDELFSFRKNNTTNTRVIGFGEYVNKTPDTDLITHVARFSIDLLKDQLGITGISEETMISTITDTAAFIMPDAATSEENKNKIGIQFFIDCTELKFEKEQIELQDISWVTTEDLKAQLQIQQMVNNDCLKFQYEEWSIVSATRINL
jgi:hypothetical protein